MNKHQLVVVPIRTAEQDLMSPENVTFKGYKFSSYKNSLTSLIYEGRILYPNNLCFDLSATYIRLKM